MMRFHLRLATLIAVLAFAEGCSNFVLGVIQSFGTPGGAKISTIAGNGTAGFSGDNGQAPAAELSQPYDVALDASGNQYIADTNNSRIRMVNTNGIITTVASGFFNPQAVVAYGTNFLYVADSGNQVIKSVTITSGAPLVALAAGTGTQGDTNLATPQLASSVDLNYPSGLAVNSSGDLYITDSQNSRILKLSSGNLILVAGSPTGAPATLAMADPQQRLTLISPMLLRLMARAICISRTV